MQYMKYYYSDKIKFSPTLINTIDDKLSFGMQKHMGRLIMSKNKIIEFMSLKMSFEDLDIQMLYVKLRRYKELFECGELELSDRQLDNFLLLTRRIEELESRPSRDEQKINVIKNFQNLISSMELYLQIWKRVGCGTTGFLISGCIKSAKRSMELFKNNG